MALTGMKIERHQGRICKDGTFPKKGEVRGASTRASINWPWIFKTILLLEGSETVSPLCGSMPSNVLVNSLCPV